MELPIPMGSQGEGEGEGNHPVPHIAVCPGVGMGHLVPFLRLASMLASSNTNCSTRVTLVTIRPTLSLAESTQISTFLSTHPHILSLDIHIPPSSPATGGDDDDPLYLRYDAVSRSSHLLKHHLSTLHPPLSALISDLMLTSGLSDLQIPNYLLITTSVRFFSVIAYLPHLAADGETAVKSRDGGVEIEIPPGLAPIASTSVPLGFFNSNHIFTKMLVSNCLWLHKAKGILLNSFDFLESETISDLRNRKALIDLPPIFPIGPLKPFPATGSDRKRGKYSEWLDSQPSKSVIYVSFGSRTTITREQIMELGDGLERSGVGFLWVIKTSIVDKDEKEKEKLEELLGDDFFERTKGRGLVVKEWVDQEEVLRHPSIGGFVSHCGWNSVMEAAQRGMPVLGWPQHGDQRVNAGVVEVVGLGTWEKGWGWGGERLVKGLEIAEKIKEVMTNQELRNSAKRVGEEATKAWDIDSGGSSYRMFNRIIVEISARKSGS